MSRHQWLQGSSSVTYPEVSPFNSPQLAKILSPITATPARSTNPPVVPIDQSVSGLNALPLQAQSSPANRASLSGATMRNPSASSSGASALPASRSSYSPHPTLWYDHPLPDEYLNTLRAAPMTSGYGGASYAPRHAGAYSSGSSASPYSQYEGGYGISPSALHNAQHTSLGGTGGHDSTRAPTRRETEIDNGSDRDGDRDSDRDRRTPRHTSRNPPRRRDPHARSRSPPSRRVACEWEGCMSTFTRKADVNRHLTSVHKVEFIDCNVDNCSRKGNNGFARKDHLLEHKRGYHRMDLPKRSVKGKGRHEESEGRGG